MTEPSRLSFFGSWLKKIDILLLVVVLIYLLFGYIFLKMYPGGAYTNDTYLYLKPSEDILAGLKPVYFRPPTYPLFLYFIQVVFGSLKYLPEIQLVISIINPICVYALSKKIFNKKLLSGSITLFASLDLQLIFYSNVTIPESITLTFVTLFSTLITFFLIERKNLYLISSIFISGLLFYLKPAYFLLSIGLNIFVIIFILVFRQGEARQKIFKQIAMLIFGIIINFVFILIQVNYNNNNFNLHSISTIGPHAQLGKNIQNGYLNVYKITEETSEETKALIEVYEEKEGKNDPYGITKELVNRGILDKDLQYKQLDDINKEIGEQHSRISELKRAIILFPSTLFDEWGYKEFEEFKILNKIDSTILLLQPFALLFITSIVISNIFNRDLKRLADKKYIVYIVILIVVYYLTFVNAFMGYQAYFRLRLPVEILFNFLVLVSFIELISCTKYLVKYVFENIRK